MLFFKLHSTRDKPNSVTALRQLRWVVVVTPIHSRMRDTRRQQERETGKIKGGANQPSLFFLLELKRKKRKNGVVFYYSSVNTWPEARYNGTWCYSSSLLFTSSFLWLGRERCCNKGCGVAHRKVLAAETRQPNNNNMQREQTCTESEPPTTSQTMRKNEEKEKTKQQLGPWGNGFLFPLPTWW